MRQASKPVMRRFAAVVAVVVGFVIASVGFAETHRDVAEVKWTWIYRPSGELVGRYGLDQSCDLPEVWWERTPRGGVWISGNPFTDYAYARRVSRNYWRIALLARGFPNLATVKRAGERWALRNKSGRLLIYLKGPQAAEAALAYLTFGIDCIAF